MPNLLFPGEINFLARAWPLAASLFKESNRANGAGVLLCIENTRLTAACADRQNDLPTILDFFVRLGYFCLASDSCLKTEHDSDR